MIDVEKTLSEYRQDHQNFINELLHFFGIPLILSSLIILANGQFLAIIFQLIIGVMVAFYIILRNWRSVTVGLLMAVGFYLTDFTELQNWKLGAGLFVGGWALQIPGHLFFEKNRPAFVSRPTLKEKVLQLLIAPLWWIEVACFYPLWHPKIKNNKTSD